MSIEMKCDGCTTPIHEDSVVFVLRRDDEVTGHYCDSECLGTGISDNLPTNRSFTVLRTTPGKLLGAGQPQQQGDVTICLTKEEADMLFSVTDSIGGSPEAGHPRAAIDRIRAKLRTLGTAGTNDVEKSGTIYLTRKAQR